MTRGLRRQAPALLIACIALLAALGGTVYAATKIDGKTIRVKSLPGNRLALASLAGNRLKPGTIGGDRLKLASIPGDRLVPGSLGGAQIDPATLGQVPSAAHADSADSARDAQTALNAVNALDAVRVNGHSAGCKPPTRFFAGACWQTGGSEAAVSAPAAALACATQGGELPTALALVAFAQQPGISLAAGDEWTGDLTNVSAPGTYAVVTVSPSAIVASEVSTGTKKYRCVIPLVS
jgi:hypothetical protein